MDPEMLEEIRRMFVQRGAPEGSAATAALVVALYVGDGLELTPQSLAWNRAPSQAAPFGGVTLQLDGEDALILAPSDHPFEVIVMVRTAHAPKVANLLAPVTHPVPVDWGGGAFSWMPSDVLSLLEHRLRDRVLMAIEG